MNLVVYLILVIVSCFVNGNTTESATVSEHHTLVLSSVTSVKPTVSKINGNMTSSSKRPELSPAVQKDTTYAVRETSSIASHLKRTTMKSSNTAGMIKPSTNSRIPATKSSSAFKTPSASQASANIQATESREKSSQSSTVASVSGDTGSGKLSMIEPSSSVTMIISTVTAPVNNTIIASNMASATKMSDYVVMVTGSKTTSMTTKDSKSPVLVQSNDALSTKRPSMKTVIPSINQNKTIHTSHKVTSMIHSTMIHSTMSILPHMTTQLVVVDSTTPPLISANGSLFSNKTMAPSMVMSISVSQTSNATAESAIVNSRLSLTLSSMKLSYTENATLASTMVRSSLLGSSHMTTPVIVESTVSPLRNGTTSSLNGTMRPTVDVTLAVISTINATTSLVMVNSTMLPIRVTKSPITGNNTIPSMFTTTRSSFSNKTMTPSRTISISISPTSNVTTHSAMVDNTMSPVLNATESSLTENATIPSTIAITMSSPSNMATQSVIVNSTLSPKVNATESSITENATIPSSTIAITMSSPSNMVTQSVMVNSTLSPKLNATESSITENTTILSSTIAITMSSPSNMATQSVMVNSTLSPKLNAANATIFSNSTLLSSAVIQTMSPVSRMTTRLTTMIEKARSSPVENTTISVPTTSSVSSSSSFPAASSSRSPSPPPQIVSVRITMNENCADVPNVQSDDFKNAVRDACSQILNIPVSYINVTKIVCGSIHVDMKITNRKNENIVQKLNEAVSNKQLNVTYNGTQLAVTQVKDTSKTTADSDDDDDNTALIIYIVFGTVLGLAFLIGIIALIVRCHNERSTGVFHLPSEEHLELSGFSSQKSHHATGGNFYGELQPESDNGKVVPSASGPETNNVVENTGNGGNFGTAYLPAWDNLPTMEMSEVGREEEDTNDNLLLTYGKGSSEEGKDTGKTKLVVESYDNVGAV